MLDGIRLFVKNLTTEEEKYLLNKFIFSLTIDWKNGEEVGTNRSVEKGGTTWREAEYRSLKFSIGERRGALAKRWGKCLKVCGSLHKYWNNGENNGNFSTQDALNALSQISDELGICLSRFAVTRMEIGVNLTFDFPVNRYISENLVAYNQYPFSKRKCELSLAYSEVLFTHYRFKVYEKMMNTLRFEVHWDDLQELREGEFKIYDASNLTRRVINRVASVKLKEKIAKIISLNGVSIAKRYFPPIAKKRERETLLRYANPLYWYQMDELLNSAIKEDLKLYNRLRKQHHRGRKIFVELIEKYGTGIDRKVKECAFDMIEKMSQC